MIKGVDYSWARPGGAAIKAAGFEFAMRYCPYQGDGGKGLSTGEIEDLRANGLAIGLVFESTAGRPQGGRETGLQDGALARQNARAIGFPDTLPVYFAVDYDATDLAVIDEYLTACAESLGAARVGVYGSYAVIEHCHATGSAAWFWQTYAWSYGRKSDWLHVYQYLNGQVLNGGAVDYNEAVDDFGQWKAEEEKGMTDNDILAVFGSTEADPAERLAAAKYRYQQAIDTGHSPFDIAAQAQSDARVHKHRTTQQTITTGEVIL